jgi:hypothetical protein
MPMSDPRRLQIVRDEIAQVLGPEAARDPQLIAAMLAAASSDFAAVIIATALREIAAVLVEPQEEMSSGNGPGLVRAGGLFRP